MIWDLLFAVIPAVILFLYGIENFSDEVRHVAGERFRSILQKATKTSLRGALAGAAVTAIVQSSTATTVIAVGLVNAGAISFLGSLGLIIGANVGTTLTAQLVAFKLTAFAPLFVVLGFAASLIRGPYRAFGKPVFYFGLVFYSLNLISSIVAPLQGDADVLSLLSMTDNILIAIGIGFVVTNLFQSSSVTAGLIVVMAQSDLITAVQAIPVILGANIGTSTTGLIVSLRMNQAAKRTAIAQFLFNFLGVLLFLPFIGDFSRLIENMGGTAAVQTANAHLIFNCISAIIFLLAIKPFSSLIMHILPQKDGEIVFAAKHITAKLPDDISEAQTLVEKEMVHMLNVSKDIFESTLQVAAGRMDMCSRIVHLRDYIDFLHSKIISAIVSLADRDISVEDAAHIAILARVADLGGLMAQQMVSMAKKFEQMSEMKMALSPDSYLGIQEMAALCRENIEYLLATFPKMPEDVDKKMRSNDELLRQVLNWHYKTYLIRLAAKSASSTKFSEILFSFERIGSIIRELRKTSISMGMPASALNLPDLINPPNHDEGAMEEESVR
ncbi:MAG: Na/Pi cotransporter family protein [Methanotrichaceae archaeon]|nr:Na/Pi cotransporter family protein [Methanotrichaceae archaeon]